MSFFHYSTSRLDSDANYCERPYALVDSSWAPPWSFRIEARIQPGIARLVRGEVAEVDLLLWTPNAMSIPYFAGLSGGTPTPAEEGNPASPPADRTRRRFDGHLGPADGYEYPQYYDPARPWMCLIRRSTKELAETTASYAFFHPYYAKMNLEADKQSLPASLVKRFRREEEQLDQQEKEAVVALDTFCSFLKYAVDPPPRRYSAEQLRSLVEDELSWEDMVDTFTMVQRGMRERWAWWKYVSLLIAYGRLPWDARERDVVSEQLSALALLPADEAYLGAWFNSAEEIPGRWMMLIARVPAYFAADLSDNGRKDAVKYASDRPVPLPVRSVLQRKIPEARSARWPVTTETPRGAPELPYANLLARSRVRPSSLGLTGWRKMDYPAAKEAVGREHGVVCPPPLRNVFDTGHWDHFVEWHSEGSQTPGDKNVPNCGHEKPVWLRVGPKSNRRRQAAGSKTIYERTLKRQYHLDAYPIIEGLEHDIDVWGIPLPPWEHYGSETLDVVLRRGVWGYTTEKPTSDLIGNKWEADANEPPQAPPKSAKEDWATANTSAWDEDFNDPYFNPKYGAPEEAGPSRTSGTISVAPPAGEGSGTAPTGSGGRAPATTATAAPSSASATAPPPKPPKAARERPASPRTSRLSTSVSHLQKEREDAEETSRVSTSSQSAVANAYASRNAARTPATRPPTEPRRDRAAGSGNAASSRVSGRAATRADPPLTEQNGRGTANREDQGPPRPHSREARESGRERSDNTRSTGTLPSFARIRLTLLAPAVDVGRLADLATVMNRAGISHEALVRVSSSGRDFVARFADVEQSSQAIARLPALSTEEAEVTAEAIAATEAEGLMANASLAGGSRPADDGAMDVDDVWRAPAFPPAAHPFSGAASSIGGAPTIGFAPTPAFGTPAFPTATSFQWPMAPWITQPPLSPFVTQQQWTTPEWQMAFPQLAALLQQAPWLFAPGYGSSAPQASPVVPPQTPQSETPRTALPSTDAAAAASPPTAAASIGGTSTSAHPPTAPRAMRVPAPGRRPDRPSLHSRIAGAPPARTLEERLEDPAPSRAAPSTSTKRPASSLLGRLDADVSKRARPSPPSPSTGLAPTASSSAAVDAAAANSADAPERKRGKRGGGAGNRRHRRRRARRLAQAAEEHGVDGADPASDREEGEYDDADDFVHRPDSPGSGAAM